MEKGEKYRIIIWNKRPPHWNGAGLMDSWQGKIVTIRSVSVRISIEEDQHSRMIRGGWAWKYKDFEVISDSTDPNTCFRLAKRR